MGEVVAFPLAAKRGPGREAPVARAPATVFENRGWRILELPAVGRYLAVAGHCRGGVEVGRFDPSAESEDHHAGTEIAVLTRCVFDERLARCGIEWLNADGPPIAILGSFVVAAGRRYHFWRDVVIETATIGGLRVARLIDGSIVIVREPQPTPLLDPFAAIHENRRRPDFDALAGEVQAEILRWADPRGQFRRLLAPVSIN